MIPNFQWKSAVRLAWLGIVCCLLNPLLLEARIGEVQTQNGQSFTGHIRLLTNTIVIVNTDQRQITHVGLTNLSALIFLNEGPPLPEVPQTETLNATNSETSHPSLPSPWKSQDIGSIPQVGEASCEGNVFHLRSSATGIQDRADAFHYMFKPVHGDSEIVARVVQIEFNDPYAQAGVMMRENLTKDSSHVFWGLTPNQQGLLQWRSAEGGNTTATSHAGMRTPHWIKLKRLGETFTAYSSRNGREWRQIDEAQFKMANEFYVGLAMAGGRMSRLNHATIDKVQEAPSVRLISYDPRLNLRSGSTVVGRIQKADDSGINVYSLFRHPPLSTAQIARMIFQWVPDRLAHLIDLGRAGVLLTSGDFVDGEFRKIVDDRVTISSVLFGLRTYDVNNEVIAIVLGPSRPAASQRYEVKTVNGTTLIGDQLSFGWNEVALQEPIIGTWRLPLSEVKEIQQVD